MSFKGVTFDNKDIYNVVDSFYKKVSEDELLNVPFASVHDWPHHIERMTNFWWIKFGGKSYMFSHYSPIPKHFYAGFNQELLNRWLKIFIETLSEARLSQEQLETWKAMAGRMGQHLLARNEDYSKKVAQDKLNKTNN